MRSGKESRTSLRIDAVSDSASPDAVNGHRGSTREKALEALTVMLRVDVRADDCMAQ